MLAKVPQGFSLRSSPNVELLKPAFLGASMFASAVKHFLGITEEGIEGPKHRNLLRTSATMPNKVP